MSFRSSFRKIRPRYYLPAALLSTLGTIGSNSVGGDADCCGIVGVVTSGDSSAPIKSTRDFLLQGLEVLKNRGYDSAGIATVGPSSDNRMRLTKFASEGEKVRTILR